MKLAHKILARLQREIRHAAAYIRARVFDTEPTEEDVLAAWRSADREKGFQACLEEWIAAGPCVSAEDL